MSWSTAVAIFIGGGAGSLARWSLGAFVARFSSFSPAGTLLANVLATALLGLIIVKSGSKGWNLDESFMLPLLTIGFCGGFSTFSTFSVDTYKLFENGQIVYAVLNVLISVIACLFIAWAVNNFIAES